MSTWARRFGYSAVGVLIGVGALSAVTAIIWPSRPPSWVLRAVSAAWLAGLVLAGCTVPLLLRDRR